MSSVDLRLLKRAFFAVGAAAGLLCTFFLLMFASVLWRDHDRPQFPYELVVAATGAIYFGALVVHTWRGSMQVLNEPELGQTIRFLSQSVLGMFVPVAVAAAFLLWLVFQPAY